MPISYYDNKPLLPPTTTVNLNDVEDSPSGPELTDDSIFDFGKEHRGRKMRDIPASYLHWFYTNVKVFTPQNRAILKYIRKNLIALKKKHRDGIWQRPTHLGE